MTNYKETIEGLGAFISVAKSKLRELVQREDFIALNVKMGHVELEFTDRCAYVCPFGKVDWVTKS